MSSGGEVKRKGGIRGWWGKKRKEKRKKVMKRLCVGGGEKRKEKKNNIMIKIKFKNQIYLLNIIFFLIAISVVKPKLCTKQNIFLQS